MKKVIFFHSPEFFPPLDFFFGLVNSDLWVVIDHVYFTTRSRQSRCRFKTSLGVTQVPVAVKHPCNKIICETIINNFVPWRRFFLRSLKYYAETPYFNRYYSDIQLLVEAPHVLLETLTLQSTLWVAWLLGKKVNYVRSVNLTGSLRCTTVAKIIPKLLNLYGGTPFNEPFQHPYYEQQSSPFEKDLSILDALMNIGADETRSLLAPSSTSNKLESTQDKLKNVLGITL